MAWKASDIDAEEGYKYRETGLCAAHAPVAVAREKASEERCTVDTDPSG